MIKLRDLWWYALLAATFALGFIGVYATKARAQEAYTSRSLTFSRDQHGNVTSNTYWEYGELRRGWVDTSNNWRNTPDEWKRYVQLPNGKRKLMAVTPCGAVHVDFLDGRYAKEKC